jgi:hypothetical protein
MIRVGLRKTGRQAGVILAGRERKANLVVVVNGVDGCSIFGREDVDVFSINTDVAIGFNRIRNGIFCAENPSKKILKSLFCSNHIQTYQSPNGKSLAKV